MKGLGLIHALTTETPSMLRAIEQQTMIRESIAIRGLSDKVDKPARDTSGTKLARAKVIFDANGTLSRSEMITKFISDLGLTQAGATTYYSKLRNDTK